MSLQELTTDLGRALAQLGDEQAIANLARSLAQVVNIVEEFNEKILRVREFSDSAVTLGVLDEPIYVQGADLITQLDSVKDSLSNRGDDEFDLAAAAELRTSLTQFADNARREAGDGWKEFCRSHGPPDVPEDFLRIFEEIHPTEVESLRHHLTTTRMYADVDIPPVKGMKAYVDATQAIPGLMAELVGDEPVVREFVQALADGGAQLALLQPPVMEWMEGQVLEDGRKVSELFRVVLPSSMQ